MEGSGAESLSSTSFNFQPSNHLSDDAFFDLHLRPRDQEFEFVLPSLPSKPQLHPAPLHSPCQISTLTLVHARKGGSAKKSRMMKFLVKLRSIVSVSGGGEARVGVLWRQRMKEGQIMVRNKFFGNPFNPSPTSSSSINSSSPPLLLHQAGGDHASSLLHSAIAHCNKSFIST